MNTALKEWAAVVRALELGRQIVLLRKGGIAESQGRFEVTNREFLLYPTYEHQEERFFVPEWKEVVAESFAGRKPGQVRIGSWARVEEVIRLSDGAFLPHAGADHVYSEAFVEQRRQYKPDHPLYVLVLRVLILPKPFMLAERPEYAGCRSWVSLAEDIDVSGSTPVLSDEEFSVRMKNLVASLRGPSQ